jgi:hypothetical protein
MWGNGSLIDMETATTRDHPVDNLQGSADGGVRVRLSGSWHTWPCTHAHLTVTGLRRVRATRGSGAAGYARRHDLNDLLESKDDDAPNRTG